VPERRRQTDRICSQETVNDEDSRHLLARLL
jgi:hypothetical protein